MIGIGFRKLVFLHSMPSLFAAIIFCLISWGDVAVFNSLILFKSNWIGFGFGNVFHSSFFVIILLFPLKAWHLYFCFCFVDFCRFMGKVVDSLLSF